MSRARERDRRASAGRGRADMTPKQRIATRIAFILFALAGALMTTVLTQKSSEASDTAFSGTFYGAYENLMTEAIGGNIWPQATSNACAVSRSEERRVGKECRSRWSPYQ